MTVRDFFLIPKRKQGPRQAQSLLLCASYRQAFEAADLKSLHHVCDLLAIIKNMECLDLTVFDDVVVARVAV